GGLWDGGRTHLYVHKLADPSGTWITAGEYDVEDFAWSPNGQQIAYVAHIPTEDEENPDFSRKNDLFTINTEGHEQRKWTDHQYVISSLTWSPDGQSIAMVADDQSYYNATLNRLYQLSLASGTITGLCDYDD
ncbi:PD40 domain-containing protein, partial [Salmonella enterica subsp. enterica serovar Enteritidis]|nr:PD40 domain-containing protein [Salmonella enterica subsp. enterica serovar Enteritidis]